MYFSLPHDSRPGGTIRCSSMREILRWREVVCVEPDLSGTVELTATRCQRVSSPPCVDASYGQRVRCCTDRTALRGHFLVLIRPSVNWHFHTSPGGHCCVILSPQKQSIYPTVLITYKAQRRWADLGQLQRKISPKEASHRAELGPLLVFLSRESRRRMSRI